ncbi:hypothetical protein [uncultured Methanobrevibacter sp.]|uniref:hypothetical protein n=1 Tax=uncultured Methanobrevibacter sp. TaxID=253161 RepID=UPI002611A881|nr:hypothetical protein [uncultured Methanobrevibacter sp.]
MVWFYASGSKSYFLEILQDPVLLDGSLNYHFTFLTCFGEVSSVRHSGQHIGDVF